MDQPLQKCENCLKQFPESKMATHFGYCRRNIKKCNECGEMFDINAKEDHQYQFHKKVKCKFCKLQFPINDLNKHEANCPQKTDYCQYCQLNVPVKDYKIHLKLCQSRTKQCQKCKKSITNKDYNLHIVDCRGAIESFPSYPTNPSKFQAGKIRATNKRQFQPTQYDYEDARISESRKKIPFEKKEGKLLVYNNKIQDSIDLELQEKKRNSKKSEYSSNSYVRPSSKNHERGEKNYVNYVNEIKPSYHKLKEENGYKFPQKKTQDNKKIQEEVRGVKRLINQPKKQQIKKKTPIFQNQKKDQKKYEIKSNSMNTQSQAEKKKPNSNVYRENLMKIDKKSEDFSSQYDFLPASQFDPYYAMQNQYFDDSNLGGSFGDFGGEQQYNMNKIIQQSYERNKKKQKKQAKLSEFSEDQELQKALEDIYEQKKSSNRKMKDLPKQLQNSQLIKQFGAELDLEKQKALYQQFSKKNRHPQKR